MLLSCSDVMACRNEISRPAMAATPTAGSETSRHSSSAVEVRRVMLS